MSVPAHPCRLVPRRHARSSTAVVALLLVLAATTAAQGPSPTIALPAPEAVAPGIDLFRLSDPGLVSPPAPISIQALRLDPRRARLQAALARDASPARETVIDISSRHRAIAAVNAGFFVLATGAPAGVLKVRGRLIGSGPLPRGAVGILPAGGHRPLRLLFDQVLAEAGRESGRDRVRFVPRLGSRPRDWDRADSIVGGAGLLVSNGRRLTAADWAVEKLRDGFATERHPRTLVGVDGTGSVWLVTVDGRNPLVSVGMTFVELQGLAAGLGLRDALNLDGGGSTTMVVRGAIANHPSDPSGPRPVSDALLVFVR